MHLRHEWSKWELYGATLARNGARVTIQIRECGVCGVHQSCSI